jgi:hypothetical protein
MQYAGLTELGLIHKMVNKAELVEEVRHTILWCLNQLPGLYRNFQRTSESRFADSIHTLSQAILKRLGQVEDEGESVRVAKAFRKHLAHLHSRLGLSPLKLVGPGATAKIR